MADPTDNLSVDEFTKATGEEQAEDPGYDAWFRQKISRALASAKADPDRRIPQNAIWKEFCLED